MAGKQTGKIELAKTSLAAFLLTLGTVASANWPTPEEVPNCPAELQSQRDELLSRRALLVAHSEDLHGKVNQQDAECRSVIKNSAEAAHCKEWKDQLLAEFKDYAAAVEAFNHEADCLGIRSQLHRDQAAMRRQMKSIEKGNAELEEWKKANEQAAKDALEKAEKFLLDSLTAGLGKLADEKLKAIEEEFRKRGPEGETWRRKLEKVADLRKRKARWSGVSDGIKLIDLAKVGVPAKDAFDKLKSKAREAEDEGNAIDAIIKEFNRDPEAREIIKEAGLETVGEGLKATLKPWRGNAVSMADFLVNYGLDAKAWNDSRLRIQQQLAVRDRDHAAVTMLDRQIKRTVKKLEEASCKE